MDKEGTASAVPLALATRLAVIVDLGVCRCKSESPLALRGWSRACPERLSVIEGVERAFMPAVRLTEKIGFSH